MLRVRSSLVLLLSASAHKSVPSVTCSILGESTVGWAGHFAKMSRLSAEKNGSSLSLPPCPAQ